MKYLKTYKLFESSIFDKVDAEANKIFSINYNNILNSEDEFCIGIYEKNGEILSSKPVIGSDVEVEIPDVDGKLLALVHTHFDGLELSTWDEEIGQEFADKNNSEFRMYLIGFNEDDELVMTYEEFYPENNEKLKSDDDIITLYHGSSLEGEKLLLKNGWKPYQVCSGGQCGNPKYLYLALSPESACYYAACKGNDKNVLEVKVPKSYLRVDPDDGMYVIENDVDKEIKSGNSLICTKELPSTAFKKYSGNFSVTGSDFDDYDE